MCETTSPHCPPETQTPSSNRTAPSLPGVVPFEVTDCLAQALGRGTFRKLERLHTRARSLSPQYASAWVSPVPNGASDSRQRSGLKPFVKQIGERPAFRLTDGPIADVARPPRWEAITAPLLDC